MRTKERGVIDQRIEELDSLVKRFHLHYCLAGGRYMKSILKLAAIVLTATISSAAFAYYDVLDTGEVMAPGKYKLTADTQLVTSEGGINVGAIFDAGFQEEFGVRALAGFGTTDYYMGGLFKWMPVPDVGGQPAVGCNVGLIYGKWHDSRDLTLRGEPLVSKQFTLERIIVTPYSSLPLGIRTRNSDNRQIDTDAKFQAQFVAGSQLQVEKWKNLQFLGEVGLDLSNNSLSHVSVAAV